MVDRDKLISMARNLAFVQEIPISLFCAIIETESRWDQYATRYEATSPYETAPEKFAKMHIISIKTEKQLQKFSWGLGQVLGATARSIGFEGQLPGLSEPLDGLYWSAVYLKQRLKKYEKLEDAISAYNAGSPKLHLNQEYVLKVIKAMGNY